MCYYYSIFLYYYIIIYTTMYNAGRPVNFLDYFLDYRVSLF